jgi:predicted regulator of Ras-like GTPase activity (Roadblock/LC7/MglB family)
MSELQSAVAELRVHAGVEHVLLIGLDGLLIHHSGDGPLDVETIAALAPGLATACTSVGDAAGSLGFSTAAIEWEGGVGILSTVSDDMLLIVLLLPNIGFAPVLRSIRQQRERLAGMA